MVILSQAAWGIHQLEPPVSPVRVVEGGQFSGRFLDRSTPFVRRGEVSRDTDFYSVFKRVLEEDARKR